MGRGREGKRWREIERRWKKRGLSEMGMKGGKVSAALSCAGCIVAI